MYGKHVFAHANTHAHTHTQTHTHTHVQNQKPVVREIDYFIVYHYTF